MTDIVLYGIKNCDTIKKARKWLEAHNVDYRFHDYRVDGIEKSQLMGWAKKSGWELLLNRRGTTWRNLPEQQRENIDESSAIELMVEHPAIIKRPVLTRADKILVGFDVDKYEKVVGL